MSLWEKIALFMPTRRTRRRRASPAAARHRQPQQTPYLGESAETPESAATSLELLFSATTLRPAISQQVPSATVILAQSAFRRLPRSVQHIPAPSPLAQASVRSPLTLHKERTRNLQVHMGLAASAIACLSPPESTTGELSRASPIAQHFATQALLPAPARPHGQPPPAHLPLLPPLT